MTTQPHSKTATKFVVRFDDDVMHAEAKARAKSEHIALNSLILRAIENELKRGQAMDRVIEMAAQAMANPQQITNVMHIHKADDGCLT